jgi:hypothetical protein
MSFTVNEQIRAVLLNDTRLTTLIAERYEKPLTAYIGIKQIDNTDDCPALILRAVMDDYELKLSKQLRAVSVLSIFIVICETDFDADNIAYGERYKAAISDLILEILNEQPIENVVFKRVVPVNDVPEKNPIYRLEVNVTYFEVV